MAEDARKNELIAELARTRGHLTTHALELRADLDFPARARRAFAHHPAVWLGGAVLLGLLIAKLPARKKPAVVVKHKSKDDTLEKAGKAGLLLGAMKIAFDFARPALIKWATHRFSDYMSTRPDARPPRY